MSDTNEASDTNKKRKEDRQNRNDAIRYLTLLFVAGYTILTYCSLQTAKDTERRQLRAYVGPESAAIERIDGAQPEQRIRISIKNYGLTPAISVYAETFDHLYNGHAHDIRADTWENVPKITHNFGIVDPSKTVDLYIWPTDIPNLKSAITDGIHTIHIKDGNVIMYISPGHNREAVK